MDLEPLLKALRRNIRLFYAATIFTRTQFHTAMIVLFGVQYLGWTYAQIGSLIWTQFGVMFACNFLGGIIADRFGRRHAYAVGVLLKIAALLPFALTSSYPLLLIASMIAGMGEALEVHTLDALVYEHTASIGSAEDHQKTAAFASMLFFAGRAIGSVIGGFVFAVSPTLPYWLSVFSLTFGLVAALNMRFSSRQLSRKVSVDRSRHIIRGAFMTYRGNPALLRFVIVASVSGFLANVLYALYQPFYINLGVSSQLIGIVMAGVGVASGAGALMMRKLPFWCSAHTIQSARTIGYTLTGVALIVLPMPLTLFAPLCMAVASGWSSNITMYVHGHTSDGVRAAVQSVVTTATMLGACIAQLIVFSSADWLPFVYIVGATTLGMGCVVFLSLRWRKKDQDE